jgi:hypothetical protein
MKTFAGWAIAAGMVVASTAAYAQVPEPYVIEASPYVGAADLDGPYGGSVDEIIPRAAPDMLPPREVFRIVRANGFAPRGGLSQRGRAYRIVVIDADGEAGRLVIDAYSGRIRRFVPADRVRAAYGRDLPDAYDRFGLPAETAGPAPRPPARIPHVASLPRAVPLPKEAPRAARTEGDIGREARRPVSKHTAPKAEPAPVARTAAAHAGTVGAATPKPSSTDTADKKPDTPEILPTQPMPPVQGLD